MNNLNEAIHPLPKGRGLLARQAKKKWFYKGIISNNEIEWTVWNCYKNTDFRKFLCPCVEISKDFKILKMKKAKKVYYSDIMTFFGDFQPIDVKNKKRLFGKYWELSIGKLNGELCFADLPRHKNFLKIEKFLTDNNIILMKDLLKKYFPGELRSDVSRNNLGIYKKRLVLIDYGAKGYYSTLIKKGLIRWKT